jgi:hypothetical protein
MPLRDDEQDPQKSEFSQKVGLKNVSTQKSIFENKPKKPTQQDLEERVKQIQDKDLSYKQKAAELALLFNKAMDDKTLKQNKNIFALDFEKDLLSRMVKLAVEINNDEAEKAGMGSMGWVSVLLKTCFNQRDRINHLEYMLSQIEKKMESSISKEIQRALDNKKPSE